MSEMNIKCHLEDLKGTDFLKTYVQIGKSNGKVVPVLN
jgi:hypothetical protein